jgi:hypothetical protein
MKRRIFLFFAFIQIFIISGCVIVYDYKFQINETQLNEMILWLRQAYQYFHVSYEINTEKRITNFDYIDGYIKIGENQINLKPETISILVKNMDTNFNILIIKDGIIQNNNYLSNQEQYLNKENNFIYRLRFEQRFNYGLLLELNKKSNYPVKLYLNYQITVNDIIINEIINEDYILVVNKNRYKLSELEFH